MAYTTEQLNAMSREELMAVVNNQTPTKEPVVNEQKKQWAEAVLKVGSWTTKKVHNVGLDLTVNAAVVADVAQNTVVPMVAKQTYRASNWVVKKVEARAKTADQDIQAAKEARKDLWAIRKDARL